MSPLLSDRSFLWECQSSWVQFTSFELFSEFCPFLRHTSAVGPALTCSGNGIPPFPSLSPVPVPEAVLSGFQTLSLPFLFPLLGVTAPGPGL